MQPATDTRFHGTKRNAVFGVVLALVILATLAVVFVEIVAVVAVCAMLFVWVLIYNVSQAFLRAKRGPVSYAVDEVGLWRGRGSHMKLLFKWNELTQWHGFQPGVGGAVEGHCEFRVAKGRVLVSHEDVYEPSAADFDAAVRRFAPAHVEERRA